jgi:hypothetical protein
MTSANRHPGARTGARGQALVEFAVVLPLQLILVFGIMQLAFLYVSMLAVNYTAFRCARCAIVGEDNVELGQFQIGTGPGATLGDEYTSANMTAAVVLAPLAGNRTSDMVSVPPDIEIPGWGPVKRSGLAAWKTRVRIDEELDPDTNELRTVTATVEFNQELVFPFVDGLFRLFMRGSDQDHSESYLFGEEDEEFVAMHEGEINESGSGRGKVRVIGETTHFVITRSCTLAAQTGWQGP